MIYFLFTEIEEDTFDQINENGNVEKREMPSEVDGEPTKTEEEDTNNSPSDGSQVEESEEINHTDSVSNIDESEEHTSNEKPVKEGTWVSRFLGNKKSSTQPENDPSSVAPTEDHVETNGVDSSETIPSSDIDEDNDETQLENSDESHEGEDVVSYGELSTIPEGKEDEEAQEEEKPQEDDIPEKPKKKGFGFSSFLTKFVVSSPSKQSNQAKLAEEESGVEDEQPSSEEKEANASEETENNSSTVNGDDQNGTPNPVQQYVFGWDEDEASKNSNANDHKKFQDSPPVSVPVA